MAHRFPESRKDAELYRARTRPRTYSFSAMGSYYDLASYKKSQQKALAPKSKMLSGPHAGIKLAQFFAAGVSNLKSGRKLQKCASREVQITHNLNLVVVTTNLRLTSTASCPPSFFPT
eukprot:6087-Rhodomonas_salina.2